MVVPSSQVLHARLGLVVAPAGCGKTQLLADVLKSSSDEKPRLVLTHTNAGVGALRARLQRASVPRTAYRLSTIDGWALRLASMFPMRSGISAAALTLSNPKSDYPQVREAAAALLHDGHITECLLASYSGLLVDEYQDCSVRQHQIVCYASGALPTCLVGDHMQAIFGLSTQDPLVPWETVQSVFPTLLELNKPWRWVRSGCEDLGRWLLVARQALENRQSVDLRSAPKHVKHISLLGDGTDHAKILNAAKWTGRGSKDGVLIIGDSLNPSSRHQLASAIQGAVVVEPVELRHMVDFFRVFDVKSSNALDGLLSFAESLMTGLRRMQLLKRVERLMGHTARKEPSDIEAAAVRFEISKDSKVAAELLMTLKNDPSVRIYRPTVLQASIRTFLTSAASTLDLHQASIQIREQYRAFGRPLPPRAVGSTLLLKGLEAGAVVIVNADELDAHNLYVALTRGSKAVVVCSASPVLTPAG